MDKIFNSKPKSKMSQNYLQLHAWMKWEDKHALNTPQWVQNIKSPLDLDFYKLHRKS